MTITPHRSPRESTPARRAATSTTQPWPDEDGEAYYDDIDGEDEDA